MFYVTCYVTDKKKIYNKKFITRKFSKTKLEISEVINLV